jgi:aspartate racemase
VSPKPLRTVGLLGGLSWHSTVGYYSGLNELISASLGGHASCPLVLWNFNFEEIVALQKQNNWAALGHLVYQAGEALAKAGAQSLAICSNTMHLALLHLPQAFSVPVIHLGNALAVHCHVSKFSRIGFLGTRFAMNSFSYLETISGPFGAETLTPCKVTKLDLDRIIFKELTGGMVTAESRKRYEDAVLELVNLGAQCVVLGCTEIGLLLSHGSLVHGVPMVDSLRVHVDTIGNWVLKICPTTANSAH